MHCVKYLLILFEIKRFSYTFPRQTSGWHDLTVRLNCLDSKVYFSNCMMEQNITGITSCVTDEYLMWNRCSIIVFLKAIIPASATLFRLLRHLMTSSWVPLMEPWTIPASYHNKAQQSATWMYVPCDVVRSVTISWDSDCESKMMGYLTLYCVNLGVRMSILKPVFFPWPCESGGCTFVFNIYDITNVMS